MATRAKGKIDFGKVVRSEMKRQGFGTRTLARKIVGAGAPLNQIDNMRGQIRDWIAVPPKHSPSRQSRIRVADALGIARELLVSDDDEEDHQAMLAELGRIARKLQLRERGGVA